MSLAWLEPRSARRGWAALIAGAAIATGGLALSWERRTTLAQALMLPDRQWTVVVGDLPRTWSSFERSPIGSRIADHAPELRPRMDAWMRQSSGIRWTPWRWNLWFGKCVSFSGKGHEGVASIPAKWVPRLIFRAALRTGLIQSQGGVASVRGRFVAQAGSFFAIGTSDAVVRQLLDTGEQWTSVGGLGIGWGSNAQPVAGGSLVPGDEIRADILFADLKHRTPDRAEYFAIEWPDVPIVSVVSRGLDLNSIVPEDDWPRFPGSTEFSRVWTDFQALLPEGWRAGADTTQFALFAVDTSEGVPVPDVAVFSRSETPLAPLRPPRDAIAYEWSGRPGWMTPWLGEGANLFVLADERSRIFTNQESTMAALVGRKRSGRIASGDARIEIDAERLAEILRALARQAAKNEVWPSRNADDVERDVIPWLNAVGALGTIRLEGQYVGDGITLRGGTQAPASEGAS